MREMEILFPKKYKMILQEMEDSKKFLTKKLKNVENTRFFHAMSDTERSFFKAVS